MDAIATISGNKELVAELAKLGRDFQRSEQIASGLGSGARRLRDEIRRNAPLGKNQGAGGFKLKDRPGQLPLLVKDTNAAGALRRGIIAYSKRQHGIPFSFVESRAPHAWLVEFGARRGQTAIAGTSRKRSSGKKALRFLWGGKVFFMPYATPGPMPARPYFRNTIDNKRSDMEMFLNSMVLDSLNEHVTKTGEYVRMK